MSNGSRLASIYADVADRHLQAAQIILANPSSPLPEIAIFHCFHALESIARATLVSHHRPINRSGTGHRINLHAFSHIATRRGYSFARGAASLIGELENLRNDALYPEGRPIPISPSERFSTPQANRALNRTRGLVQGVRLQLGI